MKSILHKSFRYVPAVETDLRKTFARIRRELKSAAERKPEPARELKVVAGQLKRKS